MPLRRLSLRSGPGVARGAARDERGAAAPAVIVIAGLLAGAAAGVVLERSGVVDPLGEPAPAVIRIDRVTAFDCPNGLPVAALARGDRVLATGRSDDGDWLQIRSPVALDRRVWVPADVVSADALAGGSAPLAATECHPEETTTTSSTTTSTSTTSTSTTSTTSTSTTTTTTTPPNVGPVIFGLTVTGRANGVPPATTTTTTTPSTTSSTTTSTTLPGGSTTTTLPPGSFQYVHVAGSGGACFANASVRVTVGDSDGTGSVRLDWTTGADGSTGSVSLLQASATEWQVTFPFPASAVPPGVEFRVPAFTVVATDAFGLASTAGVVPSVPFRVYGADALPCDR